LLRGHRRETAGERAACVIGAGAGHSECQDSNRCQDDSHRRHL